MNWNIFHNNSNDKSWDLPIPNKSIFADRCVTSLKKKYNTFPAGSTLYFVDFTHNQKWATGYGKMFQIFFSDKIQINFIEKKAIPLVIEKSFGKIFFFKYNGKYLEEILAI